VKERVGVWINEQILPYEQYVVSALIKSLPKIAGGGSQDAIVNVGAEWFFVPSNVHS
jgi:hypothetical protein